jgi:hypothetical protein
MLTAGAFSASAHVGRHVTVGVVGEASQRSAVMPDIAASPLAIRASLAPTGYVSAMISGPSGAQVQLSEQLPRGTRPIAVVTLGVNGADVPRALTWSCELRMRQLVASTLAPAPPEHAAATVVTPGCSRRLVVRVSRHAKVGGSLRVSVRDRWRIGALPFAVCVRPPGARRSCRRSQLRPGQASRVILERTPRPGGWGVSVRTRYEHLPQVVVWSEHSGGRIRLLAVGDSEMQILDDFLAQDLRPHRVLVTSDARISTGLTNSFFFNWQSHALQQAASLRPDVTVMFIGANDGFSVRDPQGKVVGCCGRAWSAGYALLVERMMRTYLRGNAGRVYWFVLPTPRPSNFQSLFNAVNAGIRSASRRFPGRVGLIDANAFFTPGNRYRDFMTYHGRGFVIHESDGIHLSTAADHIDASLVVRTLRADHLIR